MDQAGSIERRIVTILFADLVGFTSLSERLDAEDVSTVQNGYFSAVRETIARYSGQLEKFIGDAAMAVFGIPRTRDDDAERAVRAALALVGAIEQLGPRLGLEATDLRLRVGVNTGEVVLAQDASGAWRVTGDAVNVAARFQAAAPPGGVVLGETTCLAVADAVDIEPMGTLELKGKAEAVRAWAARGVRPSPSREHAMGELRAPTLGREAELSALTEAADRVAGAGSERWLVVAPPGVGKSRLLEEFARRAAVQDAVEVWRARLRPDVLSPYEPVAQVFASALGPRGWSPAGLRPALDEVLGAALQATAVASGPRAGVVIEEVAALLWPHAGANEGTGGIAAGEREQRFQAWLEALDALAGGRPVVWLVEDVHWSGGDFLAFLDHAGSAASSGRLVLATARPSLLERAPAWCAPSDGRHVLHLPRMSPVAAEALVHALVGAALPAALVRAVAERSDGNPLFIEELLRTWVSVGTLARGPDGAWLLTAPAEEVPLPATVQAIYAAQLDDLAPPARQAARTASVIGRRFPGAALEPLGVPDPDPAIEILSRRALVAGPFADPLLGRSHQFRHALLRDAGYASVSRAERALLHVRMARWLEQAAGDRWADVAEVIGNHYRAALSSTPSLAGEVGDGVGRAEAARLAASWFERAASAAVAVAAHDAARALLRQSLDLTADDDLMGKARRWQRLGDATAYVADMDEGAAAHEAAASLFRQLLEAQEAPPEDRRVARKGHADAVTALGLVRIQQVRFREAVSLAQAALDTIGPGDDLETAWLLYLRAWGTEAFFRQPETKADLERAMSLAHALGDLRLELEVGMHLVSIAGDEGTLSPPEVAAADLVAARTAAQLGEWQQVCKRLRRRALYLLETDREASAAALEEAAVVAEAHGLTEDAAWADYGWVEDGLMYGDWESALEAGIRALDLADRNAYHRVQVRTWFALSPIAAARGMRDLLERAAVWFDRYRAIFPHSPFGNTMHGGVELRLAEASLIPPVEIDPQDILPALDESQGLPSWHAAVEAVAQGWLAAGRHDAVRDLLARIALWRDHPSTEDLGRASEALMIGLLLREQGDRSGAGSAARTAMAASRACRAPWWTSRAILLLDSIQEATPQEVEEARILERSLGLAGLAR